MNIIHRLTHTKDLIFKLFAITSFVILFVVVKISYTDYTIKLQNEQALSYAEEYFRAAIQQRDSSQIDGTAFNPQQFNIDLLQPESINKLSLAKDLRTLTIHLSGARLILSDTDSDPYNTLSCHSPDGIEQKHLPRKCREQY